MDFINLKLLLRLSLFLGLSAAIHGQENGVRVVVNEGGDAVLPCSPNTKENLESKLFDWIKDYQKKDLKREVFLYDAGVNYANGRAGQDEQFKGRVSHFPEELKNSNASIKIRNTKVTDSGNYSCIFPRLHPSERFNIELVVDLILKDRSGENEGASPAPYITTLKATKDWSLLQCDVRGASPKPELEWRNRAGDVVPAEEPKVTEREGKYDVILQTTVTKTDSYYCIITQQEIHHQTYSSETSVYFHECDDSSSREIIGWVCGLFIGVCVGALTLVGVLALLFVTKKLSITFEGSRHQRKDSPTKVPLNPDV